MALSFPVGLQNLIAKGWCRVHPFVEMTLNDGTKLNYSTVDFIVDSISYAGKLKSITGGKIGLTSSVDRITFSVYNADAIIGRQMLTSRTPLEKIRAIIGTIYINIDNPSEAYRIIEDDGIVNASSASDDMFEATFISSTYTENAIVGDTPVDKDCPKQYKGVECGYAGSLPSCDRTFSGLNGCNVHFDFNTTKEQYGGHGLFLDDSYVQQARAKFPVYQKDVGNEDLGRTGGTVRSRYKRHYEMDMMDVE